MKKLLVLGGSFFQLAPIKKARELGYYVISCDYNMSNPGHKYAHECYDVSTTDKEGVLSLAIKLNIDGILSYASDIAAPTAAYVAEKLGLPTIPYSTVNLLTNKDLYKSFLREHDFRVPLAKGYNTFEEAINEIQQFKMPVIVKPVDSSGSRGVSKVTSIDQLAAVVDNALKFSNSQRFIVEEFVEKQGYMISGDGLTINGRLAFRAYGNAHFNQEGINPFIPIGFSWPANLNDYLKVKIDEELQKAVSILGFDTAPFSFDIFIDQQENVHLIEIGPRNSGYLVPKVIQYAYGIDFDEYIIKAAVGEQFCELPNIKPQGYFACYMIHSNQSGKFNSFEIDEDFHKNHVIECELIKQIGENIHAFEGANMGIGILILRFNTMNETLNTLDNMEDFYRIHIE